MWYSEVFLNIQNRSSSDFLSTGPAHPFGDCLPMSRRSLWPVFYRPPRFYSMHGTLRYSRGHPSSPRAVFGLGGVAPSHRPHKMAGAS